MLRKEPLSPSVRGSDKPPLSASILPPPTNSTVKKCGVNMTVNLTCCLCGGDAGRYGHNPAPIAHFPAVCCDTCNAMKVIPARFEHLHANEGNQYWWATESIPSPEQKEGFSPIGVYYVEGVGYCTGEAWAEEEAWGGNGTGKPPVFSAWEYICDSCTYEEDECECGLGLE